MLPNIKQELDSTPDQVVNFHGGHGPVVKTKGTIILQQLEGQAVENDILYKHLAHEQSINRDSPLVLGNKLLLLQDGPATYTAMFTAIRAARDNINLETYIMDDDEVGTSFSNLLLKKQAEGVQVNLLYDSFGCFNTPERFFDRLEDAGIQVHEFNPVNPLKSSKKEWILDNRDHRKLLIVDGRIAYVGGVNISKVYSSNPFSRKSKRKHNKIAGWRDVHLQMEGPVVAEFQKLFIDTWSRQGAKTMKSKNYFPPLEPLGTQIVRAISNTPENDQSPIYLTLLSAISYSEINAHLAIAYFSPDPQLIKALVDAAQRGVDVKLVMPSFSDSWIVFHVGRSFYTELLKGGVKIYERRDAIMHSKTASIDGVWSMIGSTNLDWRSFLYNDEINAIILGREFANQMDVMYAKDLIESNKITLTQWNRRSLIQRTKEWFSRLGAHWL